MSEHLWKKLGEVKAFATACVSFLERGKDGFVSAEIFSEEEISKLIESNEDHISAIDQIATASEAAEIVNKKAAATGEKLADMQGRYLQDEDDWHDGMELLEWSGFFFGGAVVHWNVIRGASEGVDEANLTALAEAGAEFHSKLLAVAGNSIKSLAHEEKIN